MANKLDKSARVQRSFEQLLHTLFPDKKPLSLIGIHEKLNKKLNLGRLQ